MKLVECKSCGSKEFTEENRLVVCSYCRSKFVPQVDDLPLMTAVIGMDSDIEILLQKCRDDPANARKYANLILDIDPTNREATAFLR